MCFGVPVVEGYGQTETTGPACGTWDVDPNNAGIVGGPISSIEMKLVDVPDMNYFSTGDYPKGEVCFKGAPVFGGYFKDEARTREVLDPDGWLHTGDVGEFSVVEGNLRIIDRKKNIFKLS